ncbi:MAG: hypothetical protein LC689_11020 [Myxococcales bacterium]|nr:hypothetical protein [Myxococcales bacterium]
MRVFSFGALVLGLGLAACGGHASNPGDDVRNGVDGGGVTGKACGFDTDCNPPDSVCDTVSLTCVQGCGLNPNCPPGKVCNQATGRCVIAIEGGGDGGHDGGTVGDGDAGSGIASDTLCHACTVNADCHGGGLCVSNSQHTQNFCTQDCTEDPCPTGFICALDRTGAKHQCYPSIGECSGVIGNDHDGGVVGTDGGPVNDPNVPSDNPNGCGFCGQCNVNNDCVTGSVCASGSCATGPCNSWLDCALTGAYLSRCSDVGLAQKYCLPILGQCIALPGPLAPLSGDIGCVPSGVNPSCAVPGLPSSAFGANVGVTQGVNPKPLLATEDSIVIDSQGRMAIGYIGVDGSGNSYMGVSQSTDNGVTWQDKGKMSATTSVQSDPVLVLSRWTDGSGAHERMHYVWVGYTIVQQGSSFVPTDMFMESSYSDNGGATWSAGIRATTTVDNDSGALLLDKPWIAVSPDASQTLMLTFSVGDNSQQHMYAVTSFDHGQSWTPKVQIENGSNDYGHNLGMPVFDPSDPAGNTVYEVFVTYQTVEAGPANSISLVKSADKGAHWGPPIAISAPDDQVLFEPPSISADKDHHLYIGYTSAPGSAGSAGSRYWDAMVAVVDISGGTPVVVRRSRVSDDQGDCFQHFHLMTAVDQATGRVFAGWLDNRDGGKGSTWYAVSNDGGGSWSANKRVSDTPYTFNPDHRNAQLNFLGDYFGFLFDGSKLRISWSDPRDGTSSQVFYAGGTP